ncbi:MAG: CPXCG motif-containing cysteine-rich protein [Corallincola sp.]|nr:CPXCG motif-containing cysteine-rich protein [Corallincola sp.]
MEGLSWRRITCPQCGHRYPLSIDLSVPQQDYVESCTACCAEFIVHLRQQLDGTLAIELDSDDEQIY